MRSSSGRSTSVERTGQGWKVIAPIWAAQATAATWSGHSWSAWRPDGKWTRTDLAHSGMPRMRRFW